MYTPNLIQTLDNWYLGCTTIFMTKWLYMISLSSLPVQCEWHMLTAKTNSKWSGFLLASYNIVKIFIKTLVDLECTKSILDWCLNYFQNRIWILQFLFELFTCMALEKIAIPRMVLFFSLLVWPWNELSFLLWPSVKSVSELLVCPLVDTRKDEIALLCFWRGRTEPSELDRRHVSGKKRRSSACLVLRLAREMGGAPPSARCLARDHRP